MFINWIKTLYENPETCIKNNGHLSRSISLQRGIQQGCPVSALLSIIALEVLSVNIRNNPNLRGLSLYKKNIKVLQYADDGVLFLDDENELHVALGIVKEFSNLAGMCLNQSKCEGLWLGRYKQRQLNCNIGGIKWPTEPVRCLGIYIGHNKDKKMN